MLACMYICMSAQEEREKKSLFVHETAVEWGIRNECKPIDSYKHNNFLREILKYSIQEGMRGVGVSVGGGMKCV